MDETLLDAQKKTKLKMNAFQFMMNKRHKADESNCPNKMNINSIESKKKVSKRKLSFTKRSSLNNKQSTLNNEDTENIECPKNTRSNKKRKFSTCSTVTEPNVVNNTINTVNVTNCAETVIPTEASDDEIIPTANRNILFSPRTWRMKLKLHLNNECNEDREIIQAEDDFEIFSPIKRKVVLQEIKQNESVSHKNSNSTNLLHLTCPEISHEQQKCCSDLWNLTCVEKLSCLTKTKCNFELTDLPFNTYALNPYKWTAVNTYQRIPSSKPVGKLKNLIEDMKCECPNYPVYKTFRLLRAKFSNESSRFQTWPEKYRPQMFDDLIGNAAATSELKTWLLSWEGRTAPTKAKKKCSSSSSSGSSEQTDCNVLVLLGPNGSGKTAALYALCNQLRINVLEINASSRRTGRMMLNELQEATRSHKVQTVVPNTTQTHQTSLLFVKDADLVFHEHDDGFVASLTTLAAVSKRPLVLTATDPKCAHLQKFMTQHEVVRFGPLDGRVMDGWFKILCLLEGVVVEQHLLNQLLDANKGDVRKTILQLQFSIQSSKSEKQEADPVQLPFPVDLGAIWWHLPRLFDFTSSTCEAKAGSAPVSTWQQLNTASLIMDCLAFADVASARKHPYADTSSEPVNNYYWTSCLTDSLAVTENFALYNETDATMAEITHWLLEKSLNQQQSISSDLSTAGPNADELSWRGKQQKTVRDLTAAVPVHSVLDRAAFGADYLPTFRAISRSECARFAANSKRNHRFYHYLKNFHVHLTDSMYARLCNTIWRNPDSNGGKS